MHYIAISRRWDSNELKIGHGIGSHSSAGDLDRDFGLLVDFPEDPGASLESWVDSTLLLLH